MHLASINALAVLVMRGVDKIQKNTMISGFTLRSAFVKAITGVRYSPLYIYYALLIVYIYIYIYQAYTYVPALSCRLGVLHTIASLALSCMC